MLVCDDELVRYLPLLCPPPPPLVVRWSVTTRPPSVPTIHPGDVFEKVFAGAAARDGADGREGQADEPGRHGGTADEDQRLGAGPGE